MRTWVLVGLSAAVLASSARGDVVTLFPDHDNTIYQDGDYLSNAQGTGLFIGKNGSGWNRRALLSFDLAGAMPANATVTAVTLRVRVLSAKGSSAPVVLHRLLSSWGEGTSAAPDPGGPGTQASTGDATWTQRFYDMGILWTNPGGDFAAATTSSVNMGSTFPTTYTWPSTAQFVADAQSMLNNPAANFGWIVIGNEASTGRSAKRLASRENSTVSDRPLLTVTYTVVPAPGSLGLLLPAVVGVVGVARRRRR